MKWVRVTELGGDTSAEGAEVEVEVSLRFRFGGRLSSSPLSSADTPSLSSRAVASIAKII